MYEKSVKEEYMRVIRDHFELLDELASQLGAISDQAVEDTLHARTF